MRRTAIAFLALLLATAMMATSCSSSVGACRLVAGPVVAEITGRATPGVVVGSLVAVKDHDPNLEQLYFISAKVSGAQPSGVATWAAASVDVVRKGSCGGTVSCSDPNLQPIILNANAVARAATPSLRPNTTSNVRLPGATGRAAKKSQRCAA
jgi:hypothetical protein